MRWSEEIKKVLLAGVGAVALSIEKSHELIEALIKKGEITVEQGKIFNEELKRKGVNPLKTEPSTTDQKSDYFSEFIIKKLDEMSAEERNVIKEMIVNMEKVTHEKE